MLYLYTAFECTYRIKDKTGLARKAIVIASDQSNCIYMISRCHLLFDVNKIELISCVRITREAFYSITE